MNSGLPACKVHACGPWLPCYIVPGVLWVGAQGVKQSQPIPSPEREVQTLGLVSTSEVWLGNCPSSLSLPSFPAGPLVISVAQFGRSLPGRGSSCGYRWLFTAKNSPTGASLVAQWLGVRLPIQGTRVRALVWEDPTCRGATGPREPQLLSLRVWSLCSATREAAILRGPRTAMKSGPRLPHN